MMLKSSIVGDVDHLSPDLSLVLGETVEGTGEILPVRTNFLGL